MPVRSVEIAPGVQMPIVGLGTWELEDQEVLTKVIDAAIGSGYRYIDTAMGYHNHEMIAKSLIEVLPKYGLTRNDIFIASKLSYKFQGDKAYQAGLNSLKELNTDYLDLFLIHFPGDFELDPKDPKNKTLRKDSWLALEKLKKEGKFRTIGVSNYQKWHLEEMPSYATEIPSVNQCEYHPHMIPIDIIETCKKMGIHFQAYSSLGGSRNKQKLFAEPLVEELAKKYSITKQDLLLAWAVNQGISVLPKSTNPDNVKKNFKATQIDLDMEDIKKLGSLGTVGRYCWDPSKLD